MSKQIWEHFFKPEVRSSGRTLAIQGKVAISKPSDNEIQAYIRTSTSFKVVFKTQSVASETISVDCSCPLSKKGQFCKHIWATLLVAEEKYGDFFELKTDLQKKSSDILESTDKSSRYTTQKEYQNAFKEKQAEYRKAQYQKQKERLKSQKNFKKSIPTLAELPEDVELALKYFSENGFPLRESMTLESIGLAKKKLSRIFHPDVGGSHDEIVNLNVFTEALIKHLKS